MSASSHRLDEPSCHAASGESAPPARWPPRSPPVATAAVRPPRGRRPAEHDRRARCRESLPQPRHRHRRPPPGRVRGPDQSGPRLRPGATQDFLSYAVPTIRGEVKKYFRDLGWTVRPPRRIQEIQAQITRAEGELLQRNGRSPRPSEIAEHLGADVDDVVEAMSAEGCFAPASLDRPQFRGEDSGTATVLDLMGDEDPAWSVTEARLTLAPVRAHAQGTRPPDHLPPVLRGPDPAADRRRDRSDPDAGLTPPGTDHARPAHPAHGR